MRKAFTLIELLVVIAIIAILAAILFPVFAQAKESAKSASDLSNIKQLGIAVQMYQTDYDDMLPLGHGISGATGQHGYNYSKYVPADWSMKPSPPERVDYSRDFALNTMEPYVKNDSVMASPGMTEYLYHTNEYIAPGKYKGTTSYAYNGFLHGYNASAIARVAQLPLFTGNNGNRVGIGVGFANPALYCDINWEPCYYKPRANGACADNGGSGAIYQRFDNANSSDWIYKKGQNWAFNDSHAKWRRLGATLAPNSTNWRVDPHTNYNERGQSTSYWWNGCHAWLFRPDFDFD